MKKFLTVLAVLLMASAANASIYLTINGVAAPNEIDLNPSDWIELDLEVVSDQNITGIQAKVQLSNAQGLIEPNGIEYPINSVWTMWPVYTMNSGPQHVEFTGGSFSASPGPLVIFENLMFHC